MLRSFGGLFAAALFITSPLLATTYYGGFEDTTGPSADYDYNDLVYTLTGSGLTVNSNGTWYPQSAAGVLNTETPLQATSNGTPFWNNPSWDGAGGYNIGWCIWGGGACNGGTALAPGTEYLASSTGGSVDNITFTASGPVTATVNLMIAGSTNTLGWELASGVGGINYFPAGPGGPYTFDPSGPFILVASTSESFNTLGPAVFYSNMAAPTDDIDHFAIFGNPGSGSGTQSTGAVPEPATLGLFGLSFVVGGVFFRPRVA